MQPSMHPCTHPPPTQPASRPAFRPCVRASIHPSFHPSFHPSCMPACLRALRMPFLHQDHYALLTALTDFHAWIYGIQPCVCTCTHSMYVCVRVFSRTPLSGKWLNCGSVSPQTPSVIVAARCPRVWGHGFRGLELRLVILIHARRGE